MPIARGRTHRRFDAISRIAWDLASRVEAAVLVALLLAALSLWAFIEIADEVLEGESLKFDERIVLSLRRAADPGTPVGPAWFNDAALEVTSLGSIAVLILVVAAVLGYLAIRRLWGAFWLVLAASALGEILNIVLKQAFARPRPAVVPHLTDVQTLSFPSGHAMLSAIIYLTLGALLMRLERQRRVKVYILFIALTLTALVGLSRVYLGVHYPTDILAGWSAGLAWATLCWLAARSLQRRGRVERSLDDRAAPD